MKGFAPFLFCSNTLIFDIHEWLDYIIYNNNKCREYVIVIKICISN